MLHWCTLCTMMTSSCWVTAMPTVKRFDRCRIEMYFGDHRPPHFHVVRRDDEATVYLIDTLEAWAGDAHRDDAEALEWAAANWAELNERWRKYSEEEEP
jgi:hypothetical protein